MRYLFWIGDFDGPRLAVIFDSGESSASVDVALHDVTAEPGRRRDGAFEIYRRSGFQSTQGGPGQGFFRNVGCERIRMDVEGRETDAVHRNRVAMIRAFGHEPRADDDPCILTALLDAADAAEFFNYAGEHSEFFPSSVRKLRRPISRSSL